LKVLAPAGGEVAVCCPNEKTASDPAAKNTVIIREVFMGRIVEKKLEILSRK